MSALASWDEPPPDPADEYRDGDDHPPIRRVRLTPASSIQIRRVKWLWHLRIASGTVALLAGRPSMGKSTIAYTLAAQVTRGLLPGEHHHQPRAVLVCATEDSWEHTIVARLAAADADLDLIYRVDVHRPDDTLDTAGLNLPRDLTEIEAQAARVGAVLMLLDPLMSRLDPKLDTHKDGPVRQALEPLAALADRTGMALLGLIHHNKSKRDDPLDAVMASTAFGAVARSVHTVIRDPDDETGRSRLFGTTKNNLTGEDLPSLAFTIEPYHIDTDDGPTSTGRIEWRGEVNLDIRDAMADAASGEDPTAVTDAQEWLRDHLADQGGEALRADVLKAGKAAQHSPRTLQRAVKRMGIQTEAVPGDRRNKVWRLPVEPERTPAPDACQPAADACQPLPRPSLGTDGTHYETAGQSHLPVPSVPSVPSVPRMTRESGGTHLAHITTCTRCGAPLSDTRIDAGLTTCPDCRTTTPEGQHP